MAIKKCVNCEYGPETVEMKGDKLLCHICAHSMPGIYLVGTSGAHSVPAVAARQNAYCTNLILTGQRQLSAQLQKLTGESSTEKPVKKPRKR